MDKFFSMGGYAPFIWSSYGIGIGGLVVLAVISVRTLRARERELQFIGTRQKKNVINNTESCQGEGTIHES